jgi:hypothetical protein
LNSAETGLTRFVSCAIRSCITTALVSCVFFVPAQAADTELRNEALRVRISSADGSYEICSVNNTAPRIRAGVAAEVGHKWIKSADYPKHEVIDSDFDDSLGHGRQATVTFSGLAKPAPRQLLTFCTFVNLFVQD